MYFSFFLEVPKAGVEADGGVRGMPVVRPKERGAGRRPLDADPDVSATGSPPATATFQRCRRVRVALVWREHHLTLAGGKVHVFHFESARSEQRGFPPSAGME